MKTWPAMHSRAHPRHAYAFLGGRLGTTESNFQVCRLAAATSCTRWWVEEASMGDVMRLITEKISTETQSSWANMTSFQCCPTNLWGFYMSFMISGSQASICRPYQLIEATLMYMVQSITIRYESCCICSPASTMLVILNLISIRIIVLNLKCNYCNWVVGNFMYICTHLKTSNILSLV